jgi:pimeloyl-ACP methyl ester carboxylesterase
LFALVLIIVAAVLLMQVVAQSICARRDARRFPAPGMMVQIPGGSIHVQTNALAANTGNPAIVLESGIAASSLNWGIVQPQLAAFSTTYSYDRAGYGWSPASSSECSLMRMSGDLNDLVHALNIPRPYILVGHSFGAYILRVYAQRFPEEIAGIILVDPLTPEEWIRPTHPQLWHIRRGVWFSRAGAVIGSLGVIRFCLFLLQRGSSAAPRSVLEAFGSKASETVRRILGELAKLPPQTVRLIRERWSQGKFFWTMARYIQSLPASAKEVSEYQIPVHIPVTVISGAHQPPERMAEHRAIAARSTHGKHIIAAKSAHWIHMDQPELIVQACREMVAIFEKV